MATNEELLSQLLKERRSNRGWVTAGIAVLVVVLWFSHVFEITPFVEPAVQPTSAAVVRPTAVIARSAYQPVKPVVVVPQAPVVAAPIQPAVQAPVVSAPALPVATEVPPVPTVNVAATQDAIEIAQAQAAAAAAAAAPVQPTAETLTGEYSSRASAPLSQEQQNQITTDYYEHIRSCRLNPAPYECKELLRRFNDAMKN